MEMVVEKYSPWFFLMQKGKDEKYDGKSDNDS